MTAYVVFVRDETIDQAELGLYSENVGATFVGHDPQILAAYGEHQVLEGPAIEGAVILQFTDMDAARTWYQIPAYQAAAQH